MLRVLLSVGFLVLALANFAVADTAVQDATIQAQAVTLETVRSEAILPEQFQLADRRPGTCGDSGVSCATDFQCCSHFCSRGTHICD